MKLFAFRTGLRTLWLNFIMFLPVAFDLLIHVVLDAQFAGLIPPEYYPVYTLVVLFVNAYMRTVTRTPVGVQERPK